jgi:RND family efflux transporter MFP subunit
MKKWVWGSLGLTGLALAIGGCHGDRKADAPIEAVPRPVVVVERPRREPLSDVVEIPADVEAWQEARLYAKVAGYLRDIKVDKGDHVRAGQVLATIESPETEQEASAATETFNASKAAMSQNVAEQNRAEAQRDETVAEIHGATARVDEAKAAVLRAQGDLALSRETYLRLKRVFDKDAGLIARQDLDVAEAQVHDYEAKLLAAREGVIGAQQSVLESKSKETAAERQILALKAQSSQGDYQSRASADSAQRAQTMLGYTAIRAPFPGIITARYLDPGALVQNSSSNAQQAEHPVVSLSNFDVVRIYVEIPQSDLPMVHDNTPAAIVADEIHGRVFRGKVTRLSGGLDPGTRSMLTEIDLPNRDHALHPGQLVRVRLSLATHPHALTVPLSAVMGDGDNRSVFVVSGDKARKVSIKVGLSTPDRVEVLSGLQGDESVVVTGKDTLSDGTQVDERQTAAVKTPNG